MRKTALVLSLLGLAAFSAAPALATPLLTETFTYPNGNLVVPLGNWTTHSGAGGTDIQVVSGTAAGDMAQAPDDNRTFTAQTATAKTYACFLVKIPAQAAALTGTTYFAHFKDTGTSSLVARLYVTPLSPTFTFAISVSSANAPLPFQYLSNWTSALSFDTYYNVVIDYDAAAGFSDLWVNPANESSAKVTSSTSSGVKTGTLVSAFALRQSASGIEAGTNWKWIVDNVGVGSTFDDACVASTIAVEPKTWSTVKTLYR
jgi:hypothetical protein